MDPLLIPGNIEKEETLTGYNGSSLIPNSPEFEFFRNLNLPDPTWLLSADELFSDGVLLPLDRLSLSGSRLSQVPPDGEGTEPPGSIQLDAHSVVSASDARPGSMMGPTTGSRRWMGIFKKSPRNDVAEDVGNNGKEKENKAERLLEKEKRKDKRSQGGSGSPELNINIWPFSRSRSAGNGRTRPASQFGAPATRKVTSAPCSRSNSAGESKSSSSSSNSTNNINKWPSSQGRVGVHVGRSSPVWQPRRNRTSASESRSFLGNKDPKARVLNVNVAPASIGPTRAHLGCKSVASGGSGGGGGGGLFNLRGLFTKKVH